MSRMYDRVMRQEPALPFFDSQDKWHFGLYDELHDEVLEMLSGATVVAAEQVARYWHDVQGSEWLQLPDLPALSLPISPIFVEARFPGWPKGVRTPWIREGPEHGKEIQPPYAVGMLAWSDEFEEEDAEELAEKRDFTTTPRWWVRILAVDQQTKSATSMPSALFELYIAPSGRVIDSVTPFWAHANTPEDVGGMLGWAARCTMPLMLAIAFMHCKNIMLPTVSPPPKASRKAQKRHGRPLTKYRVLEIVPMREILNWQGGARENGLKKALHICRGHFATYSEDKPLFGKYSGTFWKPQHVRGSKDRGKVIKDYAVKAPNE